MQIQALILLLTAAASFSCSQVENQSRLTSHELTFEQQRSQANDKLSSGNIDGAISQLLYLTSLRPGDEQVNKLLASAYASKGGLDLIKIAAAIQDIRLDGESVSSLTDVLPGAGQLNREWIARGNLTLSDFEQVYGSTMTADMHTAIVTFRAAYILVVLQSILPEILAGGGTPDPQAISAALVKRLPELIDVIYQIRTLIDHVQLTPATIRGKIEKFLSRIQVEASDEEISIADGSLFAASLRNLLMDRLANAGIEERNDVLEKLDGLIPGQQ